MPPLPMLPAHLAEILAIAQVCFTAPTFRTFALVACGAIARVGPATTTGMLTAAGRAGQVPHHRVAEFFSTRTWDAHRLGLVLACLVCDRLLPPGTEVTVAVDDTFIERYGPKVFARHLGHDGSAQHKNSLTWGNRIVVIAVVVHLPRLRPTPFALPVRVCVHRPDGARHTSTAMSPAAAAAKAVHQARQTLHTRQVRHRRRAEAERAAAARGHRLPGTPPSTTALQEARTRVDQAQAAYDHLREHIRDAARADGRGAAAPMRPSPAEIALVMCEDLARALGRRIHVVADAAYSTPALCALDPAVTWTHRIRIDSVLYARPAPRPARAPGRARRWGPRLGSITELAARQVFHPVQGAWPGAAAAGVSCLRPVTGSGTPVAVVLIALPGTGKVMALASTDTGASVGEVARRYRARWAVEVCFADAKQHLGLGDARNRVEAAVRRTAAFQLLMVSVVVLYYAAVGERAADTARRRARAPWYCAKDHVGFADMITRLRRDMIRTRCAAILVNPDSASDQAVPARPEISAVEQVLEDLGAL